MKSRGRKGGDCIIAIQLWEAVHSTSQSLFLKSYVGFLTSCRTGEVILDYLEVHVNFYVW